MRDLILNHVSKEGWDNSCWSDDNLASKKIYPNFQFPAKNRKWLSRDRTSTESCSMMVQRVQAAREKPVPLEEEN